MKKDNPLLKMKKETVSSCSSEVSAVSDDIMTEVQERKRMRKAAFIKMLAMVIFCICVMIFGSIAWFTSNKQNATNGMGMRVSTSLFEIKTSGLKSDNANIINAESLGYLSGDQISLDSFQTGGNTFWLELRLDDEELNKGLQPGSEGTVSFTIVPNSVYDDDTENHLAITYSYSMKAYALTEAKRQAIMAYEEIIAGGGTATAPVVNYGDLICLDTLTSDNGGRNDIMLASRELLNGHILFFEEHESGVYSGWNNTYAGTKNVAFGHEEEITLHWVWPRTFSQMAGSNSIFDSTAKTSIVDNMASNETYYFTDLDKTNMVGLNGTALTSNAITNNENAISLSAGYNNADQMIGENVQYILIEFTIDGTIEPNE